MSGKLNNLQTYYTICVKVKVLRVEWTIILCEANAKRTQSDGNCLSESAQELNQSRLTYRLDGALVSPNLLTH